MTMRFVKRVLIFILAVMATTGTNAFAEEVEMTNVEITIGDAVFEAQFNDNATAEAFLAQMPITLNMRDLHRNEKFFDLPSSLPVESTERPDTMHAGDIMLWSGNTIVLFYETFSNSYGSYVRLGRIDDVAGLAEAVGSGNVSVAFSISE